MQQQPLPQWQPYPPPLPPKPDSPLHFRVGNTLALVGGIVAGASYLLPLYSISFFGTTLNATMFSLAEQQTPAVPDQLVYRALPIVAVVLVGLAVCALLSNEAWVNLLPLGAGALGLGLMGLVFVTLPALYTSMNVDNYLSIGFWGAAGGFLLGGAGGIIDLVR